jgi:hypothetical protein
MILNVNVNLIYLFDNGATTNDLLDSVSLQHAPKSIQILVPKYPHLSPGPIFSIFLSRYNVICSSEDSKLFPARQEMSFVSSLLNHAQLYRV